MQNNDANHKVAKNVSRKPHYRKDEQEPLTFDKTPDGSFSYSDSSVDYPHADIAPHN